MTKARKKNELIVDYIKFVILTSASYIEGLEIIAHKRALAPRLTQKEVNKRREEVKSLEDI